MKAYLFDIASGLFEGETYEEPAMIAESDGITAIAPPAYENGQVPVFDLATKSWAVIPTGVARQLLSHRTGEAAECTQ
jgi:hypothetical protein